MSYQRGYDDAINGKSYRPNDVMDEKGYNRGYEAGSLPEKDEFFGDNDHAEYSPWIEPFDYDNWDEDRPY